MNTKEEKKVLPNARRTLLNCYCVSCDCTISNDFPFVIVRLGHITRLPITDRNRPDYLLDLHAFSDAGYIDYDNLLVFSEFHQL